MKSYEQLAASVVFSRKGDTMTLLNIDPSLQYVGEGRSAFVFRIKHTKKVIKIFFPEFVVIAKEEAEIYRQLEGIAYFPSLYAEGNNYIVIDYIEGMTLFTCLTKGKKITSWHINEIDRALKLASDRGLNPSDIHLRNIFITKDEKIILIDVARFRQRKQCSQWGDLKLAYTKYYSLPLFPKRIPAFLLNKIATLYKKNYFSFLTGRSASI
ncbi:protein kinase family protein [Bacillus suaedaesalsae]|uniref:Protein kinase family protein n=1 Tax=Bacillus suaedaesalsae TaxID=2810349 RepID=A0ABS2DKA4_9BACI|nr:protein kinase family protein [Bacillus suaedaesalsae]MBM6618925.1 protein kinase family protein [Bacillus suaedaesalsae]